MTRTTDDPSLAQLAQLALESQALYHGAIDGVWGPASETAFVEYAALNRYAAAKTLPLTLTPNQAFELRNFVTRWGINRDTYAAVAEAANLPAELVAALHWRESGGDFGTYLQNGDRLGQPTVHEPKGIFFEHWTDAAIAAIQSEKAAREFSGISEWTHSLASMCVFAEYYNGEGYDEKGVPDPYVLAGTAGYVKGKYVADDVYDPEAVDGQIGVLVMLRAILPAT